jgi:tetratricopeptide (TPR) repeat protein
MQHMSFQRATCGRVVKRQKLPSESLTRCNRSIPRWLLHQPSRAWCDLPREILVARSVRCSLLLLVTGILLVAWEPCPFAQTAQPSARELISRGQQALAKGDWKGAEEIFQRARRLEPSSATVHAYLGSAQIQLGKLGDAEKSFAEAVRLQPRQLSFRMSLAEVYLRQSRLDAAATEYTSLIQLDPTSFDAHYNLGLVFLKQKRCTQAVAQLEQADKLTPSLPEVAINLVDAYFCANDAAQANTRAELVRRQWWNSPKVLYSLGLTLFKNGSYELADGVLTRAWKLLPSEVEIGLQSVRCKLALRSFREALTVLQSIRGEIAPSEEVELLLGHSYVGLGDGEAAIQAFRQAVKLNPGSAPAHLALGRELFQNADLEDSVYHLQEAYRLAPHDIQVVISLSQVLVKGGRFTEVIDLLASYAGNPSVPSEIPSLLGVAYASLGHFSQAVPMLEMVTRREPKNDRAYFLLGYARAELGEAEAALSAYETAIRLNPGAGVYYDYSASVLERQGKLGKAADNLQKSLTLQPNSPTAHYGLGRVLAQMGEYQEAIGHLQKSIAAGQTPARTYYLLATCYARLGNAALAQEYRDKFAAMATQSHREEYINLSGDVEARSFGRSQFALPPSAHSPP